MADVNLHKTHGRIYVIYIATNLSNGKIYVGKARDLHRRRNEHFLRSKNCTSTDRFHLALRKYGREGFEWREIYSTWDEPHALQVEMEFVRIFDSKNKGYNLTDGGEGTSGHKHTPEACANFSAYRTGRKQNPETVEKRAASHRGKKRTAESKIRYSLAKLGVPKTAKHRDNLSKTWEIVDPWGNRFTVKNVNQFAKDKDLCASSLRSKGYNRGYICLRPGALMPTIKRRNRRDRIT